MKTHSYWIDTFEEPYRSKIMNNIRTQFGNLTPMALSTDSNSQYETLTIFRWNDSIEGWDYWYKFSETISK